MSSHSKFSPSGAHRWIPCPGSMLMEAECPNSSSEFADEGTAAHEVAARVLKEDLTLSAHDLIRTTIKVGEREFIVDAEMADYVDVYVSKVFERIEEFYLLGADRVDLYVEEKVHFGKAINQVDAFGTADAILVVQYPNKLIQLDINDLKYGRGVEVYAEENEQMMLYALGALAMLNAGETLKCVSMCIHQPRRNHFSEWECDEAHLMALATRAAMAAKAAQECFQQDAVWPKLLIPGEKQCRFCKAKAVCPALREEVAQEVFASFDSLDTVLPAQAAEPSTPERLGIAMGKLGLIEGWCKAVREKTHAEMMNGVEIPGFKLVEGRAGNRAWVDDAQAEEALKRMRLKKDEMYSYKVISPAAAAKLLEKTSPRQWKTLQPLITRSEGGPTVAPMADKRPAIELTKAVDMFDVMEAPAIDI